VGPPVAGPVDSQPVHVGLSVIFQGSAGRPDREVYAADLALAHLAEELGFDSIWGVEHHFTEYTMCPDVLQFLAYMAGRTSRLLLGTMVVVLPWHDPMRVAEQIAMLDNLSGGRVILGLGRGLGRVEFEGYRVPMGESRERFVESARMVLGGLEEGVIEHEGRFVQQPRREVRPAPFASFRGRTYAAAVSPESSRIMAELGIGILIIPQKPWEDVVTELDAYRGVFRELNGAEAPPPVGVAWVFCDRDPGRARELGHRYIGGYYHSVLRHYEIAAGHFAGTRGYEYYGKLTRALEHHGSDESAQFFTDLQVHGTPRECLDRIHDIRGMIGNEHFVAVCSYAGMPPDEAERNLRLFASEVMPALQAVPAAAR
jgi:alkanesulfonate monooxygenase SsuD/methylene tetrahydromethanopterin reductase-like flavin-dependent oxidoreductase (luciferase family)